MAEVANETEGTLGTAGSCYESSSSGSWVAVEMQRSTARATTKRSRRTTVSRCARALSPAARMKRSRGSHASLPLSGLQHWEACPALEALRLPDRNPFIPNDLSLCPQPAPDASAVPALLPGLGINKAGLTTRRGGAFLTSVATGIGVASPRPGFQAAQGERYPLLSSRRARDDCSTGHVDQPCVPAAAGRFGASE